jgi:hypothetical protein
MVHIEEEIFEKAVNKLWEYAKSHDMIFTVDGFSIKITKEITKEVENCLSKTIKNESENAEKVCRRSCLVKHEEPTEWQEECLDVCFEFWKMTERATCAERISTQLLEHLYAVETLLKTYGLWFHSYWRTFIDKVVLFIMEFKPPPSL